MDYWRLGKAWFSEPWVLWALPSRPPKSAGPRQAFTRFAFTLAEILITLGIIGIVAALTMSALIANYQKQVMATRLKQFYSMFSQATLLSVVDNGEVSGWSFPTNGWNGAQAAMFIEKYYLPYIKLAKYCGTSSGCQTPQDTSTQVAKMLMLNGVAIDATGLGGVSTSGGIYFIVDTNGIQGPNKSGVDRFTFDLRPATGFKTYDDNSVVSVDSNWSRRETLLEVCKAAPSQCVRLIQYDGWEIKDDYPW